MKLGKASAKHEITSEVIFATYCRLVTTVNYNISLIDSIILQLVT